MNILAKVQWGSRLYGTQVADSDDDFRSIVLPSKKDCYLGRIKDAWEIGEEEDSSIFSLQKALNLAAQGQSLMIELMCAPPDKVAVTSDLWKYIQENRKMFFTKKLHAFCGFAKSMSSKYSVRIDRLNEVELILSFLNKHSLRWMGDRAVTLGNYWDDLPVSANAIKTTNERNKGQDKRVYQVCGRELQATVPIIYIYDTIKGIVASYGERVKNAKDGKLDFKALAHAFRVGLQCKEIVDTGDLHFPLKDAEWLRELRLGHINFIENALDKKLDDLIVEVQTKMDASSLPASVDQKWVDEIILGAYANFD